MIGHYRGNVHDGLAAPLTLTSASFDVETTYEVSQVDSTGSASLLILSALKREREREREREKRISSPSPSSIAILNTFFLLLLLSSQQNQIQVEGEVILLNTLEKMKTFDRKSASWASARKIGADILAGDCGRRPSKLNRFLVVCFADLKQYTFYYWVCVPAIKAATPMLSSDSKTCEESSADADVLCKTCFDYSQSAKGQKPFWIVEENEQGSYECKDLGEWDTCSDLDKVLVAAVDMSYAKDSPGWPLRNLLFMIGATWGLKSVRVLCLREEKLGKFSATRSIVHTVDLPATEFRDVDSLIDKYQVVGWEHNARGGLGPRSVNLSSTLDPKQRAASAMELNLKLMRWRALPELEVDRLSSSKCLLLGAGTLGCAVARILQGWGCRKITFVDSGKVAFSNPVRQSLFDFTDCLSGGRPKAEAAAEALKRIFPEADSTGIQLTIPMPGHPVKEGSAMHKQTMDTVAALDSLVKEHDIVFLLTDTRESRWLPTVLSLAHNKLAVSVALGFDTFLVMRHGAATQQKRLGCYFCNDVAAPLNSTKNRTLDQQCTVVRPGLASIASALAVELVSSILQHPLKACAPATQDAKDDSEKEKARSVLGDLPHSIRGFLDSFSQLCISCPAFPNCVACADTIVQSYMDEEGRDAFLMKVWNDPTFLEEVTGLTELKRTVEAAMEEYDADGSEEDSDDFQLL